MSILPSLPKNVISEFGNNLKAKIEQQINKLVDESVINEVDREAAFQKTRKVHSNTNRILFSVRTGNVQNVDSYVSESQSILANLFGEAGKTHSVHDMRLNSALERFSEAKLMLQFLRSGRLSTLSEMSPCGDEEYIGAVLGFAQELSRYALGRAAEGDVISVALCQRLVVQLNGKMLEFAFRNGHLRRKFDSLKYSLRAIENSLCELNFVEPLQEIVREQTRPKRKRVDESLSVIGTDDVSVAVHLESIPSGQITDIAISTTIASDSMIEEEPYDILIDTEGFDAIRTRLEAADAIREEAIKLSRDAQKWSKQAIFAVQRAAYTEASTKLKSAESVLLKIQTLIESHPSLRYGAVSGCIEEWVEGRLFLAFAQTRALLTIADLLPVTVEASEYVGGLSDLTGELGRIAVARASHRDFAAVQDILQADLIISTAIIELNNNGRYTKKSEAVTTNLKKVEDLLYELSLQRLGGRAVSTLREREQPSGEEKTEE